MGLFLKNLLFTVLAPGTVAGLIPFLLTRNESFQWGLGAALSLPLFAGGGAIYAWCVWDFASFGRGTPAPIDAPKSLVVRGLYRYSRNPMYLGVLTVILAWVFLSGTPRLLIYAALVWTGFHSFVVFYEEPHLKETFGKSYESYRERVGRWLPRWGGISSG
jgi:protein-S-isoprenylcysteine O-methyltransferase Ste14